MSARAGTPLSQIEVELASRGQMLPFEPIDLGFALGTDVGLQTIGAVFAANLSGSRRIAAGAARDYLLGVRGVNGHAEIFKSGGRVMKNVTGYDVARGLAGSWGTLAVFSEVTFKVLPLPDDVMTLVYPDLTDDLAVELMSLAMTQPYEVSGTVHLSPTLTTRLRHKGLSKETCSLTALRLGEASCNGKSRLLVALARNAGIPARLIGGLVLRRGSTRTSHQWAEAWVAGHWLPIDPTNHHFAELPAHCERLFS